MKNNTVTVDQRVIEYAIELIRSRGQDAWLDSNFQPTDPRRGAQYLKSEWTVEQLQQALPLNLGKL